MSIIVNSDDYQPLKQANYAQGGGSPPMNIESIAQKLIDAMEKCCSAHALFAIVPGEQAVTEAALNSKLQQEAFKQLALEVESEVQLLNDYLNVMASCGDMTLIEARAAIVNEIKKLNEACPGVVDFNTWGIIGKEE